MSMQLTKLCGALALAMLGAACSAPPQPLPSNGDPLFDYYNRRVARDPSIAKRTPNSLYDEFLTDQAAKSTAAYGCPAVGQLAAAPAGFVAVVRTGQQQIGRTIRRDDGQEIMFLPETRTEQKVGGWIGMNAFGATRAVSTVKVEQRGYALVDEPNARPSISSITDRDWDSRLGNLWLAGQPVGSGFDDQDRFYADFLSPREGTATNHVEAVLKLRCAAVIDTSGKVIKRLR
jgi:hypothetical protein